MFLLVSAFETEFFICGLAPLADQLVSLFFVKENSDQMVTIFFSFNIQESQLVVRHFLAHLCICLS